MYSILYHNRCSKHSSKLKTAKLDVQTKALIEILKENPFKNPPPYEALVGKLKGKYSRRINKQHRLVYEVSKNEKIVKILSMWSHYEF